MGNKRIYELTEQTTVSDTLVVPVDNSDFAEPKYITVDTLQDDVRDDFATADTAIKTGAGLQADGTLLADESSNYLKAADFSGAGYSQSLRNMARLLDSALASLEAKTYYRGVVDVTSAELQAIATTPKTLVSNLADTSYINVVDIAGFIDWETTQYAEDNNLIIQYATSDEEIGQITSDLIQATSDKFYKGALTANHEIKVGEDIELTAAADYTTGDSPIKINITYEVISGGDLTATTLSSCCVVGTSASFTNASLVSNKLVVNHALGTTDIIAVVYNGSGEVEVITQWLGDATGSDTSNYITFDFGGAITGTYTYVLFNKNS